MLDPVRLVEALAEERAGLPQDRLREDLGSAVALIAWIAGREVLTIQELDAREPDPSDPAKDTAGKVERDQKLEPGKAKAKTRKAEQMKSLPETQKALENGEVSEAHAQALADARAKADAKARAALEQNEKRLLALGAEETAKEFRRRLERFVKVHSEDDGRTEHDRKNARQRLSAYWDRDGMLQLRGAFGPEAGQRVIQTLGERTVVTTAPDGTTWRRRPDRCQPEGRPAEPPPAAASDPGPSGAPAATLFTHAA